MWSHYITLGAYVTLYITGLYTDLPTWRLSASLATTVVEMTSSMTSRGHKQAHTTTAAADAVDNDNAAVMITYQPD